MKRSTGSTGSQGHSFSQIASAEIPRSTFDRSSTLKTAFYSGMLVPILCDEMLPGDTIKIKQRTFIRMATPLVPVLDEIYCETQYFFCPLRIIWDLYSRFMGEQPNPDDSIDFTVPQMTTAGGVEAVNYTSLSSYLGIPTSPDVITHSALFHRTYAKIWNDWYRDANLQDKITENVDAGPDGAGDVVLQRRGKRKDMFTSCLPWPQRGDPINLLFEGIVPVTGAGDEEPTFTNDGGTTVRKLMGHDQNAFATWDGDFAAEAVVKWEDTKLEVDLTLASANTINGLRSAFAVQRLLERDARGGARLTEILRAHFKVISPDARLQRPEYLGGSKTVIGLQQVPVTTQNASADVGDVGAIGIGVGASSAIMYSATEHGIIMAICSVRTPLGYQSGLHKKFTRFTRYDYFWPAFSHIGEQPILNHELHATGTGDRSAGTGDFAVFGYNEAWSQYRYRQNEITGVFQSQVTDTLDVWHLAQDFGGVLPVLDASFIQDNPPFQRLMAVQLIEEFLADFAFDIKHTRPLPTFSTPGLIDHF